MTTSPNSPNHLKGDIVVLAPGGTTLLRVISLQYNPDTLTRSVAPQWYSGQQEADGEKQMRFKGPAQETIKLEAVIDATDQPENPMIFASRSDQLRRRSHATLGMFNGRRLDDDLAVEVAKHLLRTSISAVHRYDSKVFWPNGLNPLLDCQVGVPINLFFEPVDCRFWLSQTSTFLLVERWANSSNRSGDLFVLSFLINLGTYQGSIDKHATAPSAANG